MTGTRDDNRCAITRRTFLAATSGIVGLPSGCLLKDDGDVPKDPDPTTDAETDSADSSNKLRGAIPPTVVDNYVSDNYAYLTINDEDYYDYFRIGFANSHRFTTEFTPMYGSLRVDIPEGSHFGTSMWFIPEDHWGDRCDELHVRYWIYIPDDIEIDEQLKLPAVGNRKSQGWGGRKSDGTGGWSSHIALNEGYPSGPGLEFYTYHADMEGDYGDIDEWGVTMPTGEWSQLDFYVKVNTPGEHDGVIRGWLNDEFSHERTGLMFREEGHDDLNIDEIWFIIYHGGQATSPEDNFLVLGDYELWKDHGQWPDDGY